MPQRNIIVLTAPSGAGKSTIAQRLLTAHPAIQFSTSVTTRPPREGEIDGVHYIFLSEAEFQQRIEEGDLLEYEEVYPGRYYGTLRSAVAEAAERHPVLLDIDVLGAINIKKQFGEECLTLFIAPPSLAVLANRLKNRGSETEASLQTRLARAEMELSQAEQFDAVIVNDTLDVAVAETIALVEQFLARS
ncbi:MAG: guanylate kinase [Rhodothermales bacterium]